MNQGLWVWSSDPGKQRQMIKEILESEHLMAALKAITKSKEGLSNAELDDVLSDNSNWMTLWVTRQLLSLAFIEYKVDFFGNPGRYSPTNLGRDVLQRLTEQLNPAKPVVQTAVPSPPPSVPVPPPATTAPPKPPEAKLGT